MSIRTKIILPIILTAVIVLSAATFYSYNFSVKNLEATTEQYLETVAQSRANHIETVNILYEQRARLLTSKTWLRRYLKSYYETDDQEYVIKIEEILTDIQTENPKFKHIEIINTQGQIIISTLKQIVGNDISDKDYFLKGKEDYTISSLAKGEIEDVLLHIAGPLILDGEFLGVIAVASDGQTLTNAISDHTGLGETGEIYLINRDYLMLTPSRFIDDVFLSQKVDNQNSRDCFAEAGIDEQEIEELHKSHSQTNKHQDYRGVKVLGTYVYIPQMDCCLLAEIDESEALASTRELLIFSIIRILIVLFIFFIITYLIARRISQPIMTLHRGTEIIEKGDLDHRVGTDSQDEIGQLSRSFDKMTGAIKKSQAEVDLKVAKQTAEIREHRHELEGQQEALLNVLEDVEEEKEKTKIIANDLVKFKLAVENASDHIVITDPEGITLYANKRVEEITGFPKTEVIGKKAGSRELWGGLMDKKVYQKLWKTIKKDKKAFVGEIKNRRKNGKEYDAYASIAPVLDENGQVVFFVGIERDITKERDIDRAKDEFLSIASHELRTPMTAIMGNVDMVLKGQAGKIGNEVKEYLKDVAIAADRLIKLVNDMLDVSRVEVGRMKFRLKEVNMNDIIKTLVKDFQSIAKTKNITVKYNQKEIIPKVWGDEDKLTQVALNIVGNAIKFTEKGSVTISTEVKDEMVIVHMKDTGPGIGKEDMNKLFKKFQQISTTRTMESKGTGLGLYISQRIISKLGGKIWADSEGLGKGSTFSFSIHMAGSKGAEKILKTIEAEAKLHPDQK